MKDAKCGDVWMFAGLTNNYLHQLEILYNKPFLDNQMGALHTYSISITRRNIGMMKYRTYVLSWSPFLGFRWLQLTEAIGNVGRELYPSTAYTKIIDRDLNTLNLDLKCEVLEVKQKHFNKYRGVEITRKLIEHLSQLEMTTHFQEEIRRIDENIKNGTYRPKDTKDEEPTM